MYYDLNRIDEAIAEYQAAIRLRPEYARPHTGLGNIYFDSGQYDKALTEFGARIRLSPDDAQLAYYYVGKVHHAKNNLNGAVKVYKRAIELDPKRGMFRTSLAACLLNTTLSVR